MQEKYKLNKTRLLILIFVLFANLSFAQYKTKCVEMGLKGSVKSIEETQYKLSDVNPGWNEIVLSTFAFDRNCRKTSEVTTEVGGDLKSKHEVSYDKSGNIITEIRKNVDVNADFVIKYKYEAKRLSKSELTSNGKLISTSTYSYDSKGNIATMEVKKNSKLLDINNEKFEYKYDETNKLIEETHLDGKEYSKTEYRYDEKNRLIRKVEYNQRGGITYEFDYEYDDFDNLSTEVAKYRGNSITDLSFVYEYDSQGNWINRRALSNEKTYTMQIRVITYYK